jgi:hypothetical protein
LCFPKEIESPLSEADFHLSQSNTTIVLWRKYHEYRRSD